MTDLNRKTATKVCYGTSAESPLVRVRYHSTDIVKIFKDSIVLDTGGWFTTTTKRRMNQTSEAYNLGFYVYQKAHKWFTSYRGAELEFTGNILEI